MVIPRSPQRLKYYLPSFKKYKRCKSSWDYWWQILQQNRNQSEAVSVSLRVRAGCVVIRVGHGHEQDTLTILTRRPLSAVIMMDLNFLN